MKAVVVSHTSVDSAWKSLRLQPMQAKHEMLRLRPLCQDWNDSLLHYFLCRTDLRYLHARCDPLILLDLGYGFIFGEVRDRRRAVGGGVKMHNGAHLPCQLNRCASQNTLSPIYQLCWAESPGGVDSGCRDNPSITNVLCAFVTVCVRCRRWREREEDREGTWTSIRRLRRWPKPG